MNRRTVVSMSAIAALCVALLPGAALCQQKSLKEQLAGTWAFVSAVDAGGKPDRWGPNVKGLAIFEPNGHFMFMIVRGDIPKFAANSVMQGTPEENTAVVRGIIAYFGTWSVDEANKTFTTNVEGSSFPNFVGKGVKRTITSLTADELKYTNPATSAASSTDAVWKRVK
jgi:hypothetical protein